MMADPRSKALELLEMLGVTSLPVIPRDLCKQLEISYEEQEYDGFDGLLIVSGTRAMIGVNSRIVTEGRKNYTGGHELGHYCLHMEIGKLVFKCATDDVSGLSKATIESEADQFAAELTMPKSMVKPLVDQANCDWTAIRELADSCQSSLTATAMRFVELSDFPCAFVLSTGGSVKFFRKSQSFEHFIDMDSRMLGANSLAFNAFNDGPVPEDFEPVHPGLWLNGAFAPQAEILEYTLAKNRYGQVLTLLLDEGDAIYAKDVERSHKTNRDDDDEDGLGVDSYMKTVNPWSRKR